MKELDRWAAQYEEAVPASFRPRGQRAPSPPLYREAGVPGAELRSGLPSPPVSHTCFLTLLPLYGGQERSSPHKDGSSKGLKRGSSQPPRCDGLGDSVGQDQ